MFYFSGLSYQAARGIEQTLMVIAHTKGKLDDGFLNNRNGVSILNDDADVFFKSYRNVISGMEEGEISYVENLLDNEKLCLEEMSEWW